MPTITIHNGGPGAINVTEASGQVTTMGEGTHNVFQSPLHILDLDANTEPAGPTTDPTPSTDASADLGGNKLGAADATVAGSASVTKAPTETTDSADTASVE